MSTTAVDAASTRRVTHKHTQLRLRRFHRFADGPVPTNPDISPGRPEMLDKRLMSVSDCVRQGPNPFGSLACARWRPSCGHFAAKLKVTLCCNRSVVRMWTASRRAQAWGGSGPERTGIGNDEACSAPPLRPVPRYLSLRPPRPGRLANSACYRQSRPSANWLAARLAIITRPDEIS